jgi:hypothetical protein
MNSVTSATDTSSYMYGLMQRSKYNQGMALMNLMDVASKTETFNASPLGGFGLGLGGNFDIYA